jgi:hypothetical protein
MSTEEKDTFFKDLLEFNESEEPKPTPRTWLGEQWERVKNWFGSQE